MNSELQTSPGLVWVGIPVYNNAGSIVDIARRCREQLPHVLVIDDGSTDANLVDLLKPLDVTVIRHPKNLGKGKALLTAFNHAASHGAEYLITLDGDAQHFPEDIPRFFPRLAPDTILIGSRDEISGEMPSRSRFGREFSDFWIHLEAGGCAKDTQSGFRAYPLGAVLKLQLDSHFYNFEMEIITRGLWAGLKVGRVPIRVWYPPREKRVSSFDPLRDNLRISLLHTKLVLRQMLPWPHRKIASIPASSCDNTPIDLAVTAALSIIMGIVLWPFGPLAVGYVTVRLHLSKLAAVVCVLICLPPYWPRWCECIGRWVMPSNLHPHLRWIIASHLLAIPLAIAAGWITYVASDRLKEPT